MSNKTHRNLSDEKSNCPPEGCTVAERNQQKADGNNDEKLFAGMCAVWVGNLLSFCVVCVEMINHVVRKMERRSKKKRKTVEKVLVK